MLNQRTLIDVNLSRTVAIPAAGVAVTTAYIDLVTITPGRVNCVELQLLTSAALPNLAAGTTITFTVIGSTDNGADYVPVADLPSYVLTGAANTGGSAALAAQVKLPINLPRYIALQITAAAASGNNTAVNATIQLAF